MLPPRDPLKPIEVQEHHDLPIVWLIIAGLVVAGFIANLTIDIFASGGLTIWPFIFTISALLIINDFSDKHGAGVPPLHAYGLAMGVLVFFMAFVYLISHVNPWVLMTLVAVLAVFVGRDVQQRKLRDLEIARRRMNHLCIKCLEPVTGEIDALCPNCLFPVHPERLTLMQLGRAISSRGRGKRVREMLAKNPQQRQAPKRGSSHRPITKAYSYGKKK